MYKTDADRVAAALKAGIVCHCERCGADVRPDGYHQTEHSQYGKIIAYYCSSCRQLLTQIGAGEHTAMQERAGDRPDNTPQTKED